MLSALYKSVEVVGIDANPVTRRSETVALAYDGRNEAVQIGETRQASLLDGEKKQMAEVETAGLENTHELEAVSRLAVEGNAYGSKQRAEEFTHRGEFCCQGILGTGNHLQKARQDTVDLKD